MNLQDEPFEKGLPSRSPPKLLSDALRLRRMTSHEPSRLHAAIVRYYPFSPDNRKLLLAIAIDPIAHNNVVGEPR